MAPEGGSPENMPDRRGGPDYARLVEIGIALSAEHDHKRLLETILIEAKTMCHADGGTLYLSGNMVEREGETVFEPEGDGKFLAFEIMRTDSLGIAKGGTTGEDIPFPPLPLHNPETGDPNHKNIATHVALTGNTVNVEDAYTSTQFDFSGTKKFDEGTGYRSKSFLTVPLKNHSGEIIGVLQLLNAKDGKTSEVTNFDVSIQPLIEALASQAAVAVDNQLLIDAQRRLFDSFIMVMGGAIDAKSPYTGGHCARVPELAEMLAVAACDSNDGELDNFSLDENGFRELHLASWLHDCGKVVTPEYVVDKATKLETIYDRIHEIRMRFEVLKRDAEIVYWKGVAQGGDEKTLKAELESEWAKLDDEFSFVAECNIGGEFMADEKVERLREIASRKWVRTLDDRLGIAHEELMRKEQNPAEKLPAEENLLADKPHHVFKRNGAYEINNPDHYGFNMDVPKDLFNHGELYNLGIARGTLTAEDRYIIQNHITQTIVMLEQLPFPKHLSRVPEFAGSHHETLIGTGYPRKLSKEQMSIPARIMALADVFEALTAADRPYKKPKTLSDSIKILSFMVKDKHIDPDLFRLLLKSGIYKQYAEKFLRPEQIDDVDIQQYLEKIGE
ncbi:MAG: GAF domain-containing protein [Rhodospirillaceae bacterium]|nr:GAF domain-containing protein [Rhodospirillaceae bacterium]